MEFGNVGFYGGRKTRESGEKHSEQGPGIEPGPHWWEASTLTTAPSLLPLDLVARSRVPQLK